ncbi:FHA domain-containing protein [Nocardia brasiliensis]|uniref:FHA domain-containing protein n=1 Tax=Nocardia brasiliensis TaxID=37326 RepID=UPI0004A7085B|nr:FHA domain-containing protein [Nocardia brasiliensis]MBF6548639.1 FHA domain-containing protein [Nocardia brasiliensis]
MADLTDGEVTCPACGSRGAPTLMCPNCGHDLPDTSAPPEPETSSRGGPLELVLASGARLRILPGQLVGIGRDEGFPAAVVFENYTNVSRFHGELRYDGDRLYFTDTSTNGTFVNDVRIPQHEEHPISRGDTLRLAADVPVTIEWEP